MVLALIQARPAGLRPASNMPSADAGEDQTVNVGVAVSLDEVGHQMLTVTPPLELPTASLGE